MQMIFFSDSQLWKLDGNKLQNKDGEWTSYDIWNFKSKSDMIYIENVSKSKVLGTANDKEGILEDFEEDKAEQLWKKGGPNNEGYFTLESSKLPKFMTGVSSIGLEIKGNITLE